MAKQSLKKNPSPKINYQLIHVSVRTVNAFANDSVERSFFRSFLFQLWGRFALLCPLRTEMNPIISGATL